MKNYTRRATCRICNGTNLVQVLDLGSMPPANAYLKKDALTKPEGSFPLALHFCKTCSLAQVLDVVNPEVLFKDYHFLTGASAPSVKHFDEYANGVIKPFITSKDDLVVDIGGNDGVLLSFVKDWARVLNVDPAGNLASFSEEKGVPFYQAFFTSQTADDLLMKYGKASIITANNVFAHTDPIRDVFEGIGKFLNDKGTFIFEVHWNKHLVEEGAFDQIYHEHLCFYSLHAAKYLVEASGMKVLDVQIVPTQGLSLRIYVGKNGDVKSSVDEILKVEEEAGLTDVETFLAFGNKVSSNKEKLKLLLKRLKEEGKHIVGYGAPAKGNTLLNFYHIGPDVLDYLTDTTPLKQGLYSPGMRIPIVPPERLLEETPDYALLLAWNYKGAILEKERGLREKGVKFIITVPEVEIV